MKKKLAIIGKGTAGVFALTHYLRWTDCEISVYHDPAIKTQPVGEGSTVIFPTALFRNMFFQHSDLDFLDGTIKTGLKKVGWGQKNKEFYHGFAPPYTGYHFNALKFQEHVFDRLKDKVKIHEQNVENFDDIDADFIMNCSGKPEDYDDFKILDSIAVNSVFVTQCFWDMPRFTHTLTIARPYGWVFGIPLKNRCSIGYMYNNTINTLEEVQEDVKNIFEEYNLNPSTSTNSFSFKNYYRKTNYEGRVVHNGNASFFLEPLEATSIATMDMIQRSAWDLWFNGSSKDRLNDQYQGNLARTESMIMLHYLAGSQYDTKFWKFAKKRARKNIKHIMSNDLLFRAVIQDSKNDVNDFKIIDDIGTWPSRSYKINLENLDLYKHLDKLM